MLTATEKTSSPVIFHWRLNSMSQKLAAPDEWHAQFFYISGGSIANYELVLETQDAEEAAKINCRLGLIVQFISRPVEPFNIEFALWLQKEEDDSFELISQVVHIDAYQWEYWLPIDIDQLRGFIVRDTLVVGVKMAVVSNIDQLDTLSPSVSLTEQNSQQSHRASSPVEELATDHSQVTTTHSEVFTARPQVSTSQLDVNVELPTIKPSVPSQRPVPSRVYRQPKKVTQQVSIRSLILYGFNQNKSTTETMNMICDTMGPRAVSIATVRKWYKQFRSGNFNIDNPRSS